MSSRESHPLNDPYYARSATSSYSRYDSHRSRDHSPRNQKEDVARASAPAERQKENWPLRPDVHRNKSWVNPHGRRSLPTTPSEENFESRSPSSPKPAQGSREGSRRNSGAGEKFDNPQRDPLSGRGGSPNSSAMDIDTEDSGAILSHNGSNHSQARERLKRPVSPLPTRDKHGVQFRLDMRAQAVKNATTHTTREPALAPASASVATNQAGSSKAGKEGTKSSSSNGNEPSRDPRLKNSLAVSQNSEARLLPEPAEMSVFEKSLSEAISNIVDGSMRKQRVTARREQARAACDQIKRELKKFSEGDNARLTERVKIQLSEWEKEINSREEQLTTIERTFNDGIRGAIIIARQAIQSESLAAAESSRQERGERDVVQGLDTLSKRLDPVSNDFRSKENISQLDLELLQRVEKLEQRSIDTHVQDMLENFKQSDDRIVQMTSAFGNEYAERLEALERRLEIAPAIPNWSDRNGATKNNKDEVYKRVEKLEALVAELPAKLEKHQVPETGTMDTSARIKAMEHSSVAISQRMARLEQEAKSERDRDAEIQKSMAQKQERLNSEVAAMKKTTRSSSDNIADFRSRFAKIEALAEQLNKSLSDVVSSDKWVTKAQFDDFTLEDREALKPVEDGLNKCTSEISGLVSGVQDLNSVVFKLQTNQESSQKNIDSLAEKLEGTEKGLVSRFDSAQVAFQRYVDEANNTKDSVLRLEGIVRDTSKQASRELEGLSSQVGSVWKAHKDTEEALTQTIETQGRRISEMQDNTSILQEQVTKCQENMNTLQGRVTEVEGRTATLTEKVSQQQHASSGSDNIAIMPAPHETSLNPSREPQEAQPAIHSPGLREMQQKITSLESFVLDHNQRFQNMTLESFTNNVLHHMRAMYPTPDTTMRELHRLGQHYARLIEDNKNLKASVGQLNESIRQAYGRIQYEQKGREHLARGFQELVPRMDQAVQKIESQVAELRSVPRNDEVASTNSVDSLARNGGLYGQSLKAIETATKPLIARIDKVQSNEESLRNDLLELRDDLRQVKAKLETLREHFKEKDDGPMLSNKVEHPTATPIELGPSMLKRKAKRQRILDSDEDDDEDDDIPLSKTRRDHLAR